MSDSSHSGLTLEQVESRIRKGQTNDIKDQTSRSLVSIARANVFTLFNSILVAAMILVLIVGTWKDAVFGFVMIMNAVIGIVSEWRAKRTLDALAIVDAPRARVWRDGEVHEIASKDLVLDDVMELHLGDRIAVDGIVLSSDGLEIDEALLTGESAPVRKRVDNTVLAGTAVVAGSGLIRAIAVGEEVYAQGITRQVKAFTRTVSEIQAGIDAVLRIISTLLIPVVIVVAWTQYQASVAEGEGDWRHALVLAVAAVVGMIPQGLVLLTSMNFALGSAKLARDGVLVQELPAVEVLARVDALNLDKTGTLTTGGIRLHSLHPLAGDEVSLASLTALSYLNAGGTNATAKAVRRSLAQREDDGLELPDYDSLDWTIPFNSARKWSAIGIEGRAWYFGAPEILIDAMSSPSDVLLHHVTAEAEQGRRVVLLASSTSTPTVDEEGLPIPALPADLHADTLVILEENIRPDAEQTLRFFREQGVRVRVISGDNPATVGALAASVGLESPEGGPARLLDARTLPPVLDSDEFIQAIRDHDIFGRVTPEQKRAMVRAQQHDGHTVAMTGDGVNDALALKDADLGIAMGNGASATKAVAQIVLVNNEFSVLPPVVAEGRRIIANMERVSSLFLTKTMYSLVCIVVTALLLMPYPFLPRHLTYIGVLTIGVPAFVIALGPNSRLYIPGFLSRTLSLAMPSGLIVAACALGAYVTTGIDDPAASSVATLSLMMGSLWLTSITARPLVGWRIALIVTLASVAVLGFFIPAAHDFFALAWPTWQQWTIVGVFGGAAVVLVELSYRMIYQRFGAVSLRSGR